MEKVATVTLDGNGHFHGEVSGKGFDLTATGLRAVDLMLISVGYCFGLTVEAYANHKGYKIEDLKIDVVGKKHEKENRYSEITIKVSFKSDLDEKQIQRVMEIGKRGCTVSNTMLKPPTIKTEFITE
ncbi:Uncharacterized OsmC-related protein [Persephonella hydrogeniphila]|uniref:Uncharacterized OsmC-related protein n=1 Tax=Persephonella hydrogeniphila TaxID=198703 RepID=A0A285N3F0_9AQUI|nr:OsmC family protein [Persephonella hydrogeniphila]SNZ02271.1 Uncharacterized OsmC-related protein [Persephonella hydrogeniphila]